MIADHIAFPTWIASRYPYSVSGEFPGQGDALEQLALMAFVAGKTERLRLVTSIMILPYRTPVTSAKTLATIDVLSGGRVTVGVGVGWLREEFEAVAAPGFKRRGAVSDEYLRIFKTLWTTSPASLAGEFLPFRQPALRAPACAEAATDLGGRAQPFRPPARGHLRRRVAPRRREPRGTPAPGRAALPPGRARAPDRGRRPRSARPHHLVQGADL